MNESPRCPKCGIQLSADAPAGLCPKCLVQAGFESRPPSQSEPGPTNLTPPVSGFVPPTVEELAPLFPQLEILELLGKGGMGAVYKARQPGLDRLVAVKILPPEISRDPAFAERFQREARALARLSHPHIVAVYDFGQTVASSSLIAPRSEGMVRGANHDNALCYIVMEFVDGVNLRQAIQSGGLSPQDALAIVPQICEALQFAHDEGIVHRDIKPENILIDKRGRVKIADFGLAKLMANGGRESPGASLTATHQVLGTLRYMAPEQLQGSREVDHRADIYSLGVVFYELLTGELPMGKFAPPSKRVQIDVRLDEVVLRALEQDPEQRYQQASEVKTDLDAIGRQSPSMPVATDTLSRNAADQSEAIRQAVSGPARAVLATGILALVSIPFVIFLCWWILKNGLWGGYYLDKEFWDFLLIFQAVVLPIAALTLVAARRMRNLELYSLAVTGAILALLPWSPAWLIGLPAGVWALLVLRIPAVKAAFGYRSPPTKTTPATANDVTGPAIGLIAFGIVSLVVAVLSAPALMLYSYDRYGGADRDVVADPLYNVALLLFIHFCWVCPMAVIVIVAGLALKRVRARWLGLTAGILATLPLNLAWLVGLPIGIWCLVVLNRRNVKAAFEAQARLRATQVSERSPQPESLTRSPADCLLLGAGIAFVTACGVAIWLGVTAIQEHKFTASIRETLIGMSVGLAIYSGFVGVAGVMLRRLRARLFVLLVAVIVGVFFPAVAALYVLINIHVWVVLIPLWLGLPAALWVVVRLFRDDVRRAFDAAAEQRRLRDFSNPRQPTPSITSEPRLSRCALAGAIWAGLGLMALILAALWVFPSQVSVSGIVETTTSATTPGSSPDSQDIESAWGVESGGPTAPPAFPLIYVILLFGAPVTSALFASPVFGTTICGAVAIGHIQHSGGKLYGLPLAVADALFFPLLILNGAIFAVLLYFNHWGVEMNFALSLSLALFETAFIGGGVSSTIVKRFWAAVSPVGEVLASVARAESAKSAAMPNQPEPTPFADSARAIPPRRRIPIAAWLGVVPFVVIYMAALVELQQQSAATIGRIVAQASLCFAAVYLSVYAVIALVRRSRCVADQQSRAEPRPWRIAMFFSLLFFFTALFVISWVRRPFSGSGAIGRPEWTRPTGQQTTAPKTGEVWSGNKGAEHMMFWGPNSPTVSDRLASHLGLDPSQREAMNRAFEMYFREFKALEEQNTRHETDENGHQITTIAPIRQQLPPLEERFWSELDSALDGRQLTLGRKVLYLRGGLFEFGDSVYRIEIWRVGQINPWYHWKGRRGPPSGNPSVDDQSSSGPELPDNLRRFWKEPAGVEMNE